MSLLLIGAAFAWDLGGRPALRAIGPPVLLIAFCLPLPLGLDQTFVAGLSALAARWTGHFLDLLGIANVRSGPVLVCPNGGHDVAALVGGPVSPMALAALLFGLALMRHLGFWRTLILIAAGFAFLPVVTAAAATARIVWSHGVGPDLAWTAGCIALATALALSVDQWVGIPAALALPQHTSPTETIGTAPAGPIASGGAVGRFAASAFAGLAALQVWAIAAPPPVAPEAPTDWVPQRIGPWAEDKNESPDIAGSLAAATFRLDNRSVTLVVFPAAGSMAPPVGDLEAQGWIPLGEAVIHNNSTPVLRTELTLPGRASRRSGCSG